MLILAGPCPTPPPPTTPTWWRTGPGSTTTTWPGPGTGAAPAPAVLAAWRSVRRTGGRSRRLSRPGSGRTCTLSEAKIQRKCFWRIFVVILVIFGYITLLWRINGKFYCCVSFFKFTVIIIWSAEEVWEIIKPWNEVPSRPNLVKLSSRAGGVAGTESVSVSYCVLWECWDQLWGGDRTGSMWTPCGLRPLSWYYIQIYLVYSNVNVFYILSSSLFTFQ